MPPEAHNTYKNYKISTHAEKNGIGMLPDVLPIFLGVGGMSEATKLDL